MTLDDPEQQKRHYCRNKHGAHLKNFNEDRLLQCRPMILVEPWDHKWVGLPSFDNEHKLIKCHLKIYMTTN